MPSFNVPDDGFIHGMAHPEIIGVDDQETGIGRIPEQSVCLRAEVMGIGLKLHS